MTISRSGESTIASTAASTVSVAGELLGGQREHARDVDRDVAVADHDGALVREVDAELLEVRVAVVPGDERGGGPRAGQVLAGNPHATVGLRADAVEDGVVAARRAPRADRPAHLDVAEEAKAGLLRDPLERARDGLDVLVVGRDTEPDEPPRRRQAVEHVDHDRRLLALQERVGGIEAGRPGPTTATRRGSLTARANLTDGVRSVQC